MSQIIVPAGADLLSIGKQAPRVALPLFYEDWHDGFLDAVKWGVTLAVGGTSSTSKDGHQVAGLVSSARLGQVSAATDTASLYTRQFFDPYYGQTALRSITERTCFEWEMDFGSSVTLVDNSTTFFGLSATQGGNRTTNNVIGFYFASDVLRAMVDSAATETTSALTTAPNVGTPHKYGIKIDRVDGVRYYVDDVLQATTTTNIPNINAHHINFFYQGDTAAETYVYFGVIRAWREDLI